MDSASIAVSEDELNADIRDWRPGIHARAWGKVFRRLNERFDTNDNTVILIDQMRVNFQTGGEQPAGGRIFDHQSSMTVYFRKGSWLFRTDAGYIDEKAKTKQGKGMSGQTEPAGQEIHAKIEKSRVCRPLRTATMRWDMDNKVFDRDYEYLKAAKYLNVIEVKGGGNYYYDGEKIARGEPEMREVLQEDADLREEIMDELREAAQL